ncbi:coiled-coil domain-containing protein 14-like [Styela clava]
MNNKQQSRVKNQGSENGSRRNIKSADKKKTFAAPNPVQKRGIVKRKLGSRKKSESEIKTSESRDKPCIIRTYHVSSTPLNTPLKVEKLKNRKTCDTDLQSLSDISKSSSRSSVCSSVSSGLIELLCNYNSANQTGQEKHDPPVRDVGPSDQDETLKNETKYSFVIPIDQPNCDGRLTLLSELLGKLKVTAKSVVSSGDSKNLKRLEKVIETMDKEFFALQSDLSIIQSQNFDSQIESATASLKEENATLQRKLRILNQTLAEKEQKYNDKDINLELETVQCMNQTLMEQIKKLSSLMQQLQDENKRQENVISDLRKEKKKLDEDLLHKDIEFSKSREIFSTEAGTIKTEVTNALQKVDALKRQLSDAETEGELMKVSLQQKDDEITRLNDLNKGLQSSVSRLLEDLRKASQAQKKSSNVPSSDVSNAFLNNLKNVLNTPQHTRTNYQGDASFLPQSVLNQHSFPMTKTFPPHSNKENFGPSFPVFMSGSHTTEEFLPPNNYDHVLESSRLSSMPTTSAATSPSSTKSPYFENIGISDDSLVSRSSKPTLWEQNSVSSSFISFTTRDENDFANGLAILDADIQRIQDSLHDMSNVNKKH